MRIAIIGGGISGIAAAQSLRKTGHDVQIYEKSDRIGGVWALGYPGVRLQNTRDQYRLMDVPWSTKPDLHPTSAQVQQHLNDAIDKLNLPVKLGHEVTELEETEGGWRLHYRNDGNAGQQDYDFIVLSIGQYSSGKRRPGFPGQDTFQGKIVTEREITDLSVFAGKKVLVAGFGKSALDMATFAVGQASEVHHLFRTPPLDNPLSYLGRPLLTPFVLSHGHLFNAQLGTTQCYRSFYSPKIRLSRPRQLALGAEHRQTPEAPNGPRQERRGEGPPSVTHTEARYH